MKQRKLHSHGSWTAKELEVSCAIASMVSMAALHTMDFMWHLEASSRREGPDGQKHRGEHSCFKCSLFCYSSGQQLGLDCNQIQSTHD